MEFHIAREIRDRLNLDEVLFSYTGNVILANMPATRKLAQGLNLIDGAENDPAKTVNAGELFAMGLIDELSHAIVARYRREQDPAVLSAALRWYSEKLKPEQVERLLRAFCEKFPSVAVYRGEMTLEEWLSSSTDGLSNREAAFEEMLLLWLANSNPSFTPFRVLFDDAALKANTAYQGVTSTLPNYFETRPPVAPGLGSLIEVLRAPMLASPDSLTGQLDFIREKWMPLLGEDLRRVLLAVDILREEEIATWLRFHPPGPDQHRHANPTFGSQGFVGDEFVGFEEEYVTGPDGVRRRRYDPDYQAPLVEYEAFSADQAWMPNVVLMAKNTYVWLEQLSKKYGRHIHRLDQIPDEELHTMARRGITGLWLIGLWERSRASRTIKRLRGNRDAVASAYSLKDYAIAEDLGGEGAYVNLRDRAAAAGLRLASDMVPNHMGIDSDWVIEHPEWFLARWDNPFPSYSFEGPDLSTDSRVEIKIEDHYYTQTDAAVVFRLRHHRDGSTRYVYHGNDGTMFAWNDTAQIDYSKADVREHVIQVILNVARRFPIIRFDAAMVLAKRHVQRLWFPLPGAGGSIPSRAEYAMSQEEFDSVMPNEFWREVVDRVAAEVPGTLLLAEAFWLLESYFVRTLGMHRVYNSAFMNMLRDEENAKYRSYLKKTVEFDPDILKRYVNFMSNPDERTAIDQFGSGDKFFGVSVLLATLPGLPMFGHGQIEGFTERYGMDFKQAMLDESPNQDLVARHESLIAPLLHNRRLFADSTHFVLYDFWTGYGTVDENVFAYSNRYHDQRGIVLYNNRYESTRGTIHMSVGFLDKGTGSLQQRSLAEGLALPDGHSAIMAYHDAVNGLDYLRRAEALRNFGLTVDLRGYQHIVLVNWREMQPSADEPWDRLCDALNGAGVRDLHGELARLRLRPLMDALRHAIHPAAVEAFAHLATETAERENEAVQPKVRPAVNDSIADIALHPSGVAEIDRKQDETGAEADLVTEPPHADGSATRPRAPHSAAAAEQELTAAWLPHRSSPAKKPEPEEDQRIEDFVKHARAFVLQVKTIAGPEPASSPAGALKAEPLTPLLCATAVRLPSLVRQFPKPLRRAAQRVLPVGGEAVSDKTLWAPVLGWLASRDIAPAAEAIALVDRLQMKFVLADTFGSVGLEGEAGWKAAARVRVLLLAARESSLETFVQSGEFWQDADVRWLAGYNTAEGVEYFNKEAFEELICWLQLPALMKIGSTSQDKKRAPSAEVDPIAPVLERLTAAAKTAGYKVSRFIEGPSAGPQSTGTQSAVQAPQEQENAGREPVTRER